MYCEQNTTSDGIILSPERGCGEFLFSLYYVYGAERGGGDGKRLFITWLCKPSSPCLPPGTRRQVPQIAPLPASGGGGGVGLSPPPEARLASTLTKACVYACDSRAKPTRRPAALFSLCTFCRGRRPSPRAAWRLQHLTRLLPTPHCITRRRLTSCRKERRSFDLNTKMDWPPLAPAPLLPRLPNPSKAPPDCPKRRRIVAPLLLKRRLSSKGFLVHRQREFGRAHHDRRFSRRRFSWGGSGGRRSILAGKCTGRGVVAPALSTSPRPSRTLHIVTRRPRTPNLFHSPASN
ncbi:Protein of unknown function [Gryllus bimaculatus]|nr:Protein of unknown function [Gryllus bimaculatus]